MGILMQVDSRQFTVTSAPSGEELEAIAAAVDRGLRVLVEVEVCFGLRQSTTGTLQFLAVERVPLGGRTGVTMLRGFLGDQPAEAFFAQEPQRVRTGSIGVRS